MKLSGPQIVTFCNGYLGLEEVELDNDRGNRAAEMYALLLTKAQAYRVRQMSLQKERQRMLKDHAQTDARGQIKYGESPTGLAKDRPVLWKSESAAEKAFDAWAKKADEFDRALMDVDAQPFPDDFFAKPNPITVKQSVRTAFFPLMVKQQGVFSTKAQRGAGNNARRKR